MPLLIDGYNLLHVTGLFGRGPRGSLEASRTALLNFLATALEPRERAKATIIFDAADAPPGLPDRYSHHGVSVRFACDHDSADELLEELIAADHAPKRLTVVSSDHRVQRAATKRRATAIDSHLWYAAAAERLNARKKGRAGGTELPDVKPDVALTPGEVQYWVELFEALELEVDVSPPAVTRAPGSKKRRADTPRKKSSLPKKRPADEPAVPRSTRKRTRQPQQPRKAHGRPKNLGFGDVQNPFPPGYGEDEE